MKFNFPNKNGEVLSGKLELPKNKPNAYALFAHCFTCSKDIIAANTISKRLAQKGLGVLRFDFTGLGNSQGDFSNTNFSSNVEDLIEACHALNVEFESPKILIGHSLGGAAVLRAATKLDSIKAVVTIGAPSSAEHVSHLFEKNIKEIEQEGKAQVTLAGRKFTIKKHFIDDIKESDILDGVKNFKKALLVLHSPIDNTVSIDHAAKIFTAARHPKSFITLDRADHLLMKRKDANYAAEIISSWVEKYIPKETENQTVVPEGKVLVKSRMNTKFTQDIYTDNHHVIVDEPLSYKGDNLGMSPYKMLLSGLGACTAMTIKMYAERKGIPLEEITIELSHQKIHAKDCEECETTTGKIDIIQKTISIKGKFTSEQEQKLHEIAEKCPVNRTLQSEVKINSFARM
jgi:putative redox protein